MPHHVGMAPKVIPVVSKDHDGQTVMINHSDFDPEIHEKVENQVPKPQLADDDEDEDGEEDDKSPTENV